MERVHQVPDVGLPKLRHAGCHVLVDPLPVQQGGREPLLVELTPDAGEVRRQATAVVRVHDLEQLEVLLPQRVGPAGPGPPMAGIAVLLAHGHVHALSRGPGLAQGRRRRQHLGQGITLPVGERELGRLAVVLGADAPAALALQGGQRRHPLQGLEVHALVLQRMAGGAPHHAEEHLSHLDLPRVHHELGRTNGLVDEGLVGQAGAGDDGLGHIAFLGLPPHLEAFATAALEHEDLDAVAAGGQLRGPRLLHHGVGTVVLHQQLAVQVEARAVIGTREEGPAPFLRDVDEAAVAEGEVAVAMFGELAQVVDHAAADHGLPLRVGRRGRVGVLEVLVLQPRHRLALLTLLILQQVMGDGLGVSVRQGQGGHPTGGPHVERVHEEPGQRLHRGLHGQVRQRDVRRRQGAGLDVGVHLLGVELALLLADVGQLPVGVGQLPGLLLRRMAADAAHLMEQLSTALEGARRDRHRLLLDAASVGHEEVDQRLHRARAPGVVPHVVQDIRHGGAGLGPVGVEQVAAQVLGRHPRAHVAQSRRDLGVQPRVHSGVRGVAAGAGVVR